MQCFARWKEDQNTGVKFRDQTIIQFGDSWKLLANFILLNPGSASPIDKKQYNGYLESQKLPFYVNKKRGVYYQFSIDRLMNDLVKLYSANYSGGVLKLYNLFNLKNQDSVEAIVQFKKNIDHPDMFTATKEILFGNAPVVVASGCKVFLNDILTEELKKYIALANVNRLYSLSKIDDNLYVITKAQPDRNGTIESYHPSYTFKYGNRTKLA